MCACIGLWFGLVSAETAPTPAPVPEPIVLSLRGNVSQYASGVMSTVVSNRLAWQHIAAVDGLPIAVQDCRLLGRRGVAVFDDIGAFPVTVVDCQRSEDATDSKNIFNNGVIFEVGYRDAEWLGFAGRGGVWASLEIEP